MKKAGKCVRHGCNNPATLCGGDSTTCIDHIAPSEILNPSAEDLAAEEATKSDKKHFRAVLAYHGLKPMKGE